LELKEAKVYALDISEEALSVAKTNAACLDAKVTFAESDLLAEAPYGGAHIIVANLPYVKQGSAQTHAFEPAVALYCHDHPLSLIRRFISEVPGYLKPGASVLLEVGQGQAGEVLSMLRNSLHNIVDFGIVSDLAGIGRVVWVSTQK
jgi:release factor glutamine methyltransferase